MEYSEDDKMRALKKEFDELKKECTEEIKTLRNRIECIETDLEVTKNYIIEFKKECTEEIKTLRNRIECIETDLEVTKNYIIEFKKEQLRKQKEQL